MEDLFLHVPLIVLLIFTYLLGSVPFGLLFSKLFGHGDLRQIGSGNIGATNALRTGNKALATLTLLFDLGKGAVATQLYFALTLSLASAEDIVIYDVERGLQLGLAAIVGHCFPVWLKFKGGKGVATTFGVLFAAVPWAGLIAAAAWGVVAGFTRYSSLSALCAVAIVPIVTFIYYEAMSAVITILIAALVFWRHKDNIQRLMTGTESKIGDKKTDQKKDKDEPAATTE